MRHDPDKALSYENVPPLPGLPCDGGASGSVAARPPSGNARVVDVIRELKEYNVIPLVHDAEADPAEAMREYGQELVDLDQLRDLDAVLLAVSHKAYAALTPEDIKVRCRHADKAVLMDVKAFFDPQAMRAAGIDYWRL